MHIGSCQDDAKTKIEEWRQYYREARPHSALQWAMPSEFALQARESAESDISSDGEPAQLGLRPVLPIPAQLERLLLVTTSVSTGFTGRWN